MAKEKVHTKITISIPVELNSVIDRLVSESKKTTRPISKSAFFVVSAMEYLSMANNQLQAEKHSPKGGN